MNHSPAAVVAQLLIDLGLGVEPSQNPADDTNLWPVKYSKVPDLPDDVLVVMNTAGTVGPRDHAMAERSEFPGVQVFVRSLTEDKGYRKARAVAVALDGVYQRLVRVDSTNYTVHALKRTSDVIPVGRETPTSSRRVFTVNAEVTIRQD